MKPKPEELVGARRNRLTEYWGESEMTVWLSFPLFCQTTSWPMLTVALFGENEQVASVVVAQCPSSRT